MAKPRIGIIISNFDQPRMVQGFDHLHDEFEISFYVTDKPGLTDTMRPSAKMYLFEDIRDMPGYMRGLEEFAKDLDLMVGIETSRLASFQMVRIGAKYKIPCVVLVSEIHPFFYANFANVRAIQMDIFENAQLFMPLSQLGKNMLSIEGIAAEQIEKINPYIDTRRFEFKENSRKRFREYIGIKPDETLLLYQAPFEARLCPQEILSALRIIRATDPKLSQNLRCLFIGDGAFAKDLKYLCYDYRLGDRVLFMHQNPEPFLNDLYCASDIRLIPSLVDPEMQEIFPQSVLESSAVGVIPVYRHSAQLAELLLGTGFSLSDDRFQTYLDVLLPILSSPSGLSDLRAKTAQNIRTQYSVENWVEKMRGCLTSILNQRSSRQRFQSASSEKQLSNLISTGKISESHAFIDQELTTRSHTARERSELLRIRGDLWFGQGQLESSMSAYEESIQADDNNYRSYRGLGYIAFRGHSHEDAIVFFKKALARCEDDAPSLLGVGLVHRRLGLNEEALFWLERCIEIEGMSPKTSSLLVQTCLDCRQPKKSIATLERLVEQHDNDPGILQALGQLHLNHGNLEVGKQWLAKAAALETDLLSRKKNPA